MVVKAKIGWVEGLRKSLNDFSISFLSIDAKVIVCNGLHMVCTRNLVADWLCCICLG